ncbi:DUF4868 domain-containing protein [Candidatus Bathyarchaeota archaeon]|nr:DUF4868 domain-containing protein [Candidatus Bathyarchaeota archaeon]
MTADDALNGLKDFMRKPSRANILMAAGGDSGNFDFQRLTLTDALSEEFRQNVLSVVDNDYSLRRYEPGYKPDDDELCYLSLSGPSLFKDVIDGVSKFDQAALFKEDDGFIDNLRFYGVIVDNRTQQAIFFREFGRKKELTRSRWIPVVSNKGTYSRVKRKIFLFDDDVDCFSWNGYLFIKSVPAFQRIFGYFDALVQKAEQTIRSVVTRVRISNIDDFTNACKANPRMLAKLAQISEKSYLKRVTMTDIKRVIAHFGVDVKIKKEGGTEKLVFEGSPAKRWNILKLLDDDYLNSMMTKFKYESNSKTQI